MFPIASATTAFLSEPARVGDRHTMPARSPSGGGIPSRAIGLQGIMFATWGLSPAGCLGPDGAQENSMKQEGREQGTTFEKMT